MSHNQIYKSCETEQYSKKTHEFQKKVPAEFLTTIIT